MRRPQPTVRLRLTLLYGGLFLATGVLMLALTYGLLSRSLQDGGGDAAGNKGAQTDHGNGDGPSGTVTAGDKQSVQDQIDSARRDERTTTLRKVPLQAGIALIITTAAALLLGWFAAGRVLRPLRSITAHARHASEATLGDRIALRGPRDELKELADTIDAMLGRLEAAFAAQRRFSAEASHELRTPLAIIRAEADVALAAPDATERERVLALSIRNAVDRSERLVDGLLALARSESTLHDHERVDLAELVGDVMGEQARAASIASVELNLDLSSATVIGDRTLLWRLVGNLVENAIQYNRPGGWVRVAARTENGLAMVSIENSGTSIASGVVAELFEPFRRGSRDPRTAPSGHGLGLAIVRSVVAAHAGSVTATAREGGGLTVIVRIPGAIQIEPDSTMHQD